MTEKHLQTVILEQQQSKQEILNGKILSKIRKGCFRALRLGGDGESPNYSLSNIAISGERRKKKKKGKKLTDVRQGHKIF